MDFCIFTCPSLPHGSHPAISCHEAYAAGRMGCWQCSPSSSGALALCMAPIPTVGVNSEVNDSQSLSGFFFSPWDRQSSIMSLHPEKFVVTRSQLLLASFFMHLITASYDLYVSTISGLHSSWVHAASVEATAIPHLVYCPRTLCCLPAWSLLLFVLHSDIPLTLQIIGVMSIS